MKNKEELKSCFEGDELYLGEYVKNKIDQLDEPETLSINKEQLVKRIENYTPLHDKTVGDVVDGILEIVEQLPEMEVLSPEWIENERWQAYDPDGRTLYWVVSESDLEEVLVPKKELPVIPQWVANNIESKKRAGVRLNVAMSDFPEFKLEKELDIDEYECNEIYARAWLDGYTVEEEQKYIVKLPLPGDETNDFAVVDIYGYIWTDDEWPSGCKMTEKEIKALPKGEAYFEHFAVKVEEME